MGSDKESPRKLFVERMKREGREQEWHERVRETIASTGKQFGAISYAVMREMGYVSPEKEREIHADYLANIHKTAAQAEMDRNRDEIREEIKEYTAVVVRKTFEQALNDLPPNAPVRVETDWVAAHPAMMRRDRQDHDRPVIIDVDDVLHAPHGRAPSRAAVGKLQHWCNRPAEFHKQLLSEDKKAEGGGGGGAGVEGDVDLAEVKQLLGQMRQAKEEV